MKGKTRQGSCWPQALKSDLDVVCATCPAYGLSCCHARWAGGTRFGVACGRGECRIWAKQRLFEGLSARARVRVSVAVSISRTAVGSVAWAALALGRGERRMGVLRRVGSPAHACGCRSPSGHDRTAFLIAADLKPGSGESGARSFGARGTAAAKGVRVPAVNFSIFSVACLHLAEPLPEAGPGVEPAVQGGMMKACGPACLTSGVATGQRVFEMVPHLFFLLRFHGFVFEVRSS